MASLQLPTDGSIWVEKGSDVSVNGKESFGPVPRQEKELRPKATTAEEASNLFIGGGGSCT